MISLVLHSHMFYCFLSRELFGDLFHPWIMLAQMLRQAAQHLGSGPCFAMVNEDVGALFWRQLAQKHLVIHRIPEEFHRDVVRAHRGHWLLWLWVLLQARD